MFSSKYIVPSFVGLMLSVGVVCTLLTACHFGDDDDGMAALARKKRNLNYQLSLSLPNRGYSRQTVQDLGPEGLNLNWGNREELAVFGQEFVAEADSLAILGYPAPIRLTYDKYLDASAMDPKDSTRLTFQFSAYARHGVGDRYATLVNVVYPYNLLTRPEARTYNTHSDSLWIDFTGQDGLLSHLRQNYFVALGRAKTLCTQNRVQATDSALQVITSADTVWDNQVVQMVPKVAVVRLSLAVQAQSPMTLLDYLNALNMLSPGHYIDHITVRNRHQDAPPCSKALLHLSTGRMEPQEVALNELTLTDPSRFWQHPDIAPEEEQPLGPAGDYLTSWGTSVYLSVPCTDDGALDFAPLITVYIRQVGCPADQAELLYGVAKTVRLEEGGYYLTSPIMLQPTLDENGEEAIVVRF